MNKLIKLARDCDVVQIPSGDKLTLSRGKEVELMQSLGGSFTLTTGDGLMVRLNGKDADAIGEIVPEESKTAEASEQDGSIGEKVWAQLKTCFDPEIPVNIVDLGLIYACKIEPTDNGQSNVDIEMTLTAQGCGMGPSIAEDARSKVQSIPGVKEAVVRVVWEPPWNPSMMAEEAKKKLGM